MISAARICSAGNRVEGDRLVHAQGNPPQQFVEEVQQEYDAVARPLRSFGWRERNNVLAVRRRIIASRGAETNDLFDQTRGLSDRNPSPCALYDATISSLTWPSPQKNRSFPLRDQAG